ncbi:MAG: amino acid adenylation domain-containing protein, partial [Pedobacter sp.]
PNTGITELTGHHAVINSLVENIYIPQNENINTLITNIVKEYGDKTAVVFNNESFTYKDLSDKVNQLANFLSKKGVCSGDIVALSIERSMEMLISLLAILKTGAAYLPLDPEYPIDRIEFMLEDSASKLLLVSQSYKHKYQTYSTEIVLDEIWSDLSNYQTQYEEKEILGNDLAYILYTSGSTGKPKGVKITHRNLVNFLISMKSIPGIKSSDRLLAITTISFDIAGLELYLPLISGAELVIADAEATKDGRILLNILSEKKISIMQATPSTWQMILDSGWENKFDLKVLSGGEALPKDLAPKLLELSDELWNMYGPTETTIWSTVKQIQADDKVLTIGLPINNTQVYIMDEEGKPLPHNQIGEIYIGGDGVASGYLNRAELTAEKFVQDKVSGKPGSKLYRTGDLGKLLDNNEIQCLGRIDHQVKIRGHRIELGEIESMISKQNGIKQAVVLAREDVAGDKRLIAYVTLEDDASEKVMVNSDEKGINVSKEIIQNMKNNLNEILPAYMVPEDFIALKSFPLTPNAKIDRKALPKPRNKKIAVKTNQKLSLTKNEELVRDIWEDALTLTDLKAEDDFFELGGHSLIAVKVMVAIEKKTGKRLPLATLFNNSTIEKLAKQLADNEPAEKWDTLVAIKTGGKKDPIFLIHGGGLNILLFRTISKYFDSEQPVYGLQALGLNHETEIPETMAEIAARYVKEILQVHPDGPYIIAGYSLGGFIGFEMAKQLKEMGKEIKLLGIMDTYAGNNDVIESKLTHTLQKIKRQFHKVPFFTKSFIQNPKEALEYQMIISKKRIDKLVSPDAIDTKDVLTEYELKIYRKYNTAHNNYILQPADLKIALFRVSKRLYYLDDLVNLGWGKFAKKGVSVHEIPGDHKTFLFPPYDKQFAEILQKTINNL